MFSTSTKLRKTAIAGAGLLIAVTTMGVGQTVAFAATPTNPAITYSVPGTYTYTVPANVTQLQTTVAGAAGTSANGPRSAAAGNGTAEQGTIPVTPGETITVLVGSNNGHSGWGTAGKGGAGDNGGYSGGNGGSASAIATSSPQLVSGGGGGAGGRSSHQPLTNDAKPGGAGGGTATSVNGSHGEGEMVWKSRGGAGGYEAGGNGGNGNLAHPKKTGDFGGGGGGGGAGWHGGRGGGAGNGGVTDMIGGGGGGAGSSYLAADVTGGTTQTGANSGNGSITSLGRSHPRGGHTIAYRECM